MAPKIPTKLSLFLLLVVAMFVSTQATTTPKKLKETKMTLYFQDYISGPNLTLPIVTGIPGRVWSLFSFGTIAVSDDIITQGPDRNSPQIAKGQGLYVISSMNGADAHSMQSIVFTNKEFNGSTLEIQGRFNQLQPVTELSVVSGTGKFRFARGYIIFQTISFDPTTGYAPAQANLTVQHYY